MDKSENKWATVQVFFRYAENGEAEHKRLQVGKADMEDKLHPLLMWKLRHRESKHLFKGSSWQR